LGGLAGEVGEFCVDVGSDVAGRVTRDAAREDDGGDFGGVVGHGGGRQIERVGGGAELDTRAGGGSGAGDDGGDGVGGEILGGHGEAGRVGVVERAAVGEGGGGGIDDEDFELARDAELGGDELRVVDEDGGGVVEERLFGGDGCAVGGEVGIDLPDRDSTGGKAGAEGAERGGGLEGARMAEAGEDEDDGFGGRFVVKFAGGAGVIGQPEVGHQAAGREAAGGFGQGEHARVEGACGGVIHAGEPGGWDGSEDEGGEKN
jgi:hypothetical protein